MRLIAGLGNPGSQYERNRHNVGFMAVDRIHRQHSFAPWRRKFQALVADGQIEGEKALLMKPMTYMNESGRAIGQAVKFYKLAPADVLVIYDELDLPAGKIRMKRGGGHGGHNGPRSVHAHIGPDYRRLRIGIGHPGDRNRVHNWVLSDFAKADAEWLDPLLDAIAENSGYLATGADDTFSNRMHGALAGGDEKPKKPAPAGSKPATKARPTAHERPGGATSNPFVDALRRLLGKSDNTG